MLQEYHEGNETELVHVALESCPRSIHAQSSTAWWPEGAACPSPEDSIGVGKNSSLGISLSILVRVWGLTCVMHDCQTEKQLLEGVPCQIDKGPERQKLFGKRPWLCRDHTDLGRIQAEDKPHYPRG